MSNLLDQAIDFLRRQGYVVERRGKASTWYICEGGRAGAITVEELMPLAIRRSEVENPMPNPDFRDSLEGRPTLATILPWPDGATPRRQDTRCALRTLHAPHNDVATSATRTDRRTLEQAIATALGAAPTPDRRRAVANLLLTLAEELEDQATAASSGARGASDGRYP